MGHAKVIALSPPSRAVLRLAPEPTDEELVRAALAGDGKAEERLIRRHAPQVTRVLARILGSSGDVADQAQEVLIRAIRDLSSLREPAAFRAWVVAMSVTRARKALRSRARWSWLFGDPEDREAVVTPDEPGREALRAVYAVFRHLGEEERTVFALRYLEQMELTEIATSTGWSLATVKRRLVDANKRFGLFAKSHAALAPWLASSRFAESEVPS